VDRWRAGEPQQTFIVVPVGSTLDLLDQRARAGAIPGLSDADQLYADTVHLTNVGAYAIACTWFAVLTGRDPARLPTTGYEPDGTVQGNHPLTQPLADAIRRAAWEVVATHPDSGVTDSARAPAIATPALPPAVTGCVYTHELLPAFGTPPRHWQVVSGPATIDAATGILSGTWEQPGTATVVVRLTDSSDRSADTTFPLRIEADTTPTIGDAALPTLGVGERLDCQLSVAEGNPPYTWKLAGGKLPAGIALERNGRLVGTPSAPGRASVRVAVSDGDPERPDTAMRNLELTVEDRPGTYVRVPGGAHPTVDGTLADDEGWQLDQQAGAVRFGVRWSPRGYLCVAARVTDDAVVTAKDPEAGDGLVVWIDGLNNREPIYNADDQRLLIPTSGRFTARGDLRFIQAACQRTGSELTFEAVMRLTNLAVEAKPGSCLGFDIGYRDIDTLGAAPTVTPWRGTDRNDYDPSHFGVLILGPAAR
jgi:hypothetical protein